MRSAQVQTNFSAGEISERMYGRVDLPQYASALEICENAHPVIQGGVKRSPGLRYVAATKTATKKTRLIPFVFSTGQGYVLEFGHQYVRFYRDGAQIVSGTPVEVVSPYPESVLFELEYCQQADTLLIFHKDYAPRRLTRLSDTSWKLGNVAWIVQPYEELGDQPAMTLTLGATTGATTATSSANYFTDADVGRQITSGLGVALITGYTSATQVNITVADAFASVGPIASGSWTVTGSPRTKITPTGSITLGGAVTLTATAAAFKTGLEIGTYIEINSGLVQITGFTSSTVIDGVVRMPLSSLTAAESGGWRRHLPIMSAANGYPSCGVFYDQRLMLSGIPAYPGYVYGSQIGQYFNFTRGTGAGDAFLFDLVSAEYNRTLHMVPSTSLLALTSGGEFNITGGPGGGTVFGPLTVQRNALSDYGCNMVRPVKFGDDLLFVQGSGLKVRSLQATSSTNYVANDLTRYSDHMTGTGVVQLATQREPESFIYACRADGQMAVLSLYRDAVNVDAGVNGWSRRTTDGYFESVCRIPANGVDQVLVVVARTVNGSLVRYVEYFDDARNTDACVLGSAYGAAGAVTSAVWSAGVVTVTKVAHGWATGNRIRHAGFTPTAYNIDATITVTGADTYTFPLAVDPGAVSVLGTAAKGTATAVWLSLGHLEGKTVDILADGVVMPPQTVSGGQVTLPRTAYEVEIGLHYTSTLKLLPIEVSPGLGTSIGGEVSVHEVVVNLIDSVGLSINGEVVPFRKFGPAVLDKPVAPFTGTKRLGQLSSLGTGGVLTITQEQPLPFHVVNVVRKFTFNA